MVHSTGILLEVDYKKIVQGKEGLLTGLTRLVGAGCGRNPLEQGEGEREGEKITYETMNRDSGMESLSGRELYVAIADEAIWRLTSYNTCSRIILLSCSFFCVYLRRCRRAPVAKTLPFNQKRSGIDNRVFVSKDEKYFLQARFSIRLLEGVYDSNGVGRQCR